MTDKKKILVIDDDCDFLESLHLVLLNYGHAVLPVSDGHEALARYREFKPDIVFLDIRMPGIDGYEVFMRIKKLDRKARVIFTSSYMLDDERYRDAKSMSLASLMNKPIEPASIQRAIRRYAK